MIVKKQAQKLQSGHYPINRIVMYRILCSETLITLDSCPIVRQTKNKRNNYNKNMYAYMYYIMYLEGIGECSIIIQRQSSRDTALLLDRNILRKNYFVTNFSYYSSSSWPKYPTINLFLDQIIIQLALFLDQIFLLHIYSTGHLLRKSRIGHGGLIFWDTK